MKIIMMEKQPISEKCINCPNRGRLSKVLAQIAGKSETAPDCEGPVVVSHGVIETRIRKSGEPSLSKKEFDWNSVTGSAFGDGDVRYSRTDWTRETVCGREPIEPREGEVPYSLSRPTWTNEDGTRRAAFITGDEESLRDHYGSLEIIGMLNAVSEMQAAEDEGDLSGVQEAQGKIEGYGFRLDATAGRRDGKTSK